jgi:adrenodoxin-NADP+ reductase
MLERAFVCAQCTTQSGWSSILRSNLKPVVSYSVRRLSSHAAQVDRSARIAIVGSGPAGFYAASRLLSKHQDAVVDMYEKLPVPFGLARYGVAPDHPEVKVCAQQQSHTSTSESSQEMFIV